MSIRKPIGGNGPIPDIVPYVPESVEVAEYIARLGPREWTVHDLAQRRLQTSYEPVKTNGFLKWQKQRETRKTAADRTPLEDAEDAYYAHVAEYGIYKQLFDDKGAQDKALVLSEAVQKAAWEGGLSASAETLAAKAAGKKWAVVYRKQVQGYHVTKKGAANAPKTNASLPYPQNWEAHYMAKL
jgi:hypothetical protein